MRGQQNIKPRYEVEFVDEMVKETHYVREDDRNVEKEVEVPHGYNVYFPAGHSIRVRTKEELERLGYDQPAELIDEDGEVVGSTAQQTLKRNVQHRAAASKRRKAHTTGVDAKQGG
jgi:hypothetical protein